jgi:hypothetical protein
MVRTKELMASCAALLMMRPKVAKHAPQKLEPCMAT